MPLNIKNEEAHELARRLAEIRGMSLTDTVVAVLREAFKKEEALQKDHSLRLLREINEIVEQASELPILDSRSDDEILGYDDTGVPV